MEAPEKHYDPFMGFYFSCPHCHQKYDSPECVQQHSYNCQVQSPSVWIPQIESYSPLNTQALDLNFGSEGFQIHHGIIKKEPEDQYAQADNTDWQDVTDESSVINPSEIYQKSAHHRQLKFKKILPKSKIFPDSVQHPDSTCKGYQNQNKMHPRGMWNECEWWPRILPRNQPPKTALTAKIIPESETLLSNQEGFESNSRTHHSTGELSMADQDEVSQHRPSENASTIFGSDTIGMGQPLNARNNFLWKIAEPMKFMAVNIIPNVHGTQQSSQKIQLYQSSKFDQKTQRGNNKVSTRKTQSLASGACNDSFENFDALQFQLQTHPRSEAPQAGKRKALGKTTEKNFHSVRTAPRYPIITIGETTYFCCGFPDCDAVFKGRNSRYYHHKKFHCDAHRALLMNSVDHHKILHTSSEERAIADNPVWPNFSKTHNQVQVPLPLEVKYNEDQILSKEFSKNRPQRMFAQAPVQAQVVDKDQALIEVATHEVSGVKIQSTNSLQFGTCQDSLTQSIPYFNDGYTTKNALHTNGALVNELVARATTCNLNLVGQLERSGQPLVYPIIQIGSRKFYCCGFQGCKCVFNSSSRRSAHHRRHQLGFQNFRSKLQLTENGMVWDTAKSCLVMQ